MMTASPIESEIAAVVTDFSAEEDHEVFFMRERMDITITYFTTKEGIEMQKIESNCGQLNVVQDYKQNKNEVTFIVNVPGLSDVGLKSERTERVNEFSFVLLNKCFVVIAKMDVKTIGFIYYRETAPSFELSFCVHKFLDENYIYADNWIDCTLQCVMID